MAYMLPRAIIVLIAWGLTCGLIRKFSPDADPMLFFVAGASWAGAGIAYFAYLRRDADTDGYRFWLNVLNESGTNGDPVNYRGMVCSFITSAEYQRRFSSVVTHSNAECGR